MSRNTQQFDDARELPDDPLGRLLMLQVEGELSPREREELETRLRDDPAAQARYARYVALHAWLDWDRAAEQEDAIPEVDSSVSPRAGGGRKSRWLAGLRRLQRRASDFVGRPVPLSVLVSSFVTPLLLLLVVSYLAAPWVRSRVFYPASATPIDDAPVVARLHSTYQPQWGEGSSSAADGARLREGQSLDLTDGYAEIVFDSGARVILRSPSRFTLESPSSGRLDVGSLTSYVPRAAIGFKINTPSATVVDLGTEFGVEASVLGESHVSVFAGAVELIAGDEGAGAPRGRRQRLRAGQQARITSAGNIQRNRPAPNGFVRKMPLPNSPPMQTIAHWRLGEDDRNARAGELVGEATHEASDLLSLKRSGSPRYIDTTAAPGSTLAVEFPDEPGAYLATATLATKHTDHWLLEAWVRADTTVGKAIVAYNGDSSRSGFGLSREGNQWAAVFGGVLVMRFNAPVQRGQWTHLALVRHNGKTRLYVDGIPMSVEFDVEPRVPRGTLAIAGHPLEPEQTFVGAIDEVRLSALSAEFSPELLHSVEN